MALEFKKKHCQYNLGRFDKNSSSFWVLEHNLCDSVEIVNLFRTEQLVVIYFAMSLVTAVLFCFVSANKAQHGSKVELFQ